MTFPVRSAATIRTELLERWRANYLALTPPEELDVTEGSDAYNQADALSFELEAHELAAREAAHRVLLRECPDDDLVQFATDDGTARKPASPARLSVTVAGPTSATTPVAGATLGSASGLRFTPIDPSTGARLASITTDGGGAATITVECATPGTVGNLPSGTVLTWSSAPTGFAATATVSASARRGEDIESYAALRQRLLDRRAERPGSGNRADWEAWTLAVAGVGEAYVYQRTRPDTLGYRLGCVTTVPLVAPPSAYTQADDGALSDGLDPAYSRVPSTELINTVNAYYRGEVTETGTTVPTAARVEKYATELEPLDVQALRATTALQDVIVHLATDDTVAPWPFVGVRSVSGADLSGDGSLWVDLDDASGIVTDMKVAVFVGTAAIRGGYEIAQVAGYSGSRITFTRRLRTHVLNSSPVYPAPSVWDAVRAAVLAAFDSLGPGPAPSSGGAPHSSSGVRFPFETTRGQSRLYPSRLLNTALNVSGVTDGLVTVPASLVTSTTAQIIVPGYVRLERAT